jgi:flagellar basal-body rod protein FlgB
MVESLFQSDNYSVVKKLLDVAAMRHEALASNIANVETPGYKRVDLNKTFEAELRADLRAGDARAATRLQPALAEDSTAISSRADGNNVQLDRELLAMTGNSTNFDVLTQFASSSLKQLRTAIIGRTA